MAEIRERREPEVKQQRAAHAGEARKYAGRKGRHACAEPEQKVDNAKIRPLRLQAEANSQEQTTGDRHGARFESHNGQRQRRRGDHDRLT